MIYKEDYKCKPDEELAQIMLNYIGNVEHLLNMIGGYIEGNRYIPPEKIKARYTELKRDLKETADYVSLARNQKGSQLYMGYFIPSIQEAAVFGFQCPTNSKVSQELYSTVADALYKLTKYHTQEEWEVLM